MDIISKEFSARDHQASHKPTSKKRGREEAPTTSLRGGTAPSRDTRDAKRLYISQDQINKRIKDNHCYKCGIAGHYAAECRNNWRNSLQPRRIQAAPQQQATSTALVKHQPQSNKPKTDKGHFRITELGSEEDQQQQENE